MHLEHRLTHLKRRTRWLTAALALILNASMGMAHIAAQAETPKPAAKVKALDDTEIADLVESALGERPKVVRSGHFRIITLRSTEEAKKLTELAERVHLEFVRLMQDEPGTRYWKGVADEFVCRTRPQYLTLADKVMARYVENMAIVDFFKCGGSAWLAEGPFGMNDCSRSPARNAVVHHAGQHLIKNAVGLGGRRKPVWLWGFAWNMEERFTGSIRIVFSNVKRYGDGNEAEDPRGKLEEWSATIASSAREGRLMKFVEVKKQKYINEWDPRIRAHIWALVKFLVHEHPEPFAKWIKLMRRLPPDEAFQKSFGWTVEHVDEHWHPWVGKRFAKKSGG